jgi:hypothetical protein
MATAVTSVSFRAKIAFIRSILATVASVEPGIARSPIVAFTAVTTPEMGVVRSTTLRAAT